MSNVDASAVHGHEEYGRAPKRLKTEQHEELDRVAREDREAGEEELEEGEDSDSGSVAGTGETVENRGRWTGSQHGAAVKVRKLPSPALGFDRASHAPCPLTAGAADLPAVSGTDRIYLSSLVTCL